MKADLVLVISPEAPLMKQRYDMMKLGLLWLTRVKKD